MLTGSVGGASGSENWETYTDASDDADEADATEAYYAKVKAQQQQHNKRPAASAMGPPAWGPVKRVREQMGVVEEKFASSIRVSASFRFRCRPFWAMP